MANHNQRNSIMPKGTGGQEHQITRDPARLPQLAPLRRGTDMTTLRSPRHKESDIISKCTRETKLCLNITASNSRNRHYLQKILAKGTDNTSPDPTRHFIVPEACAHGQHADGLGDAYYH